MIGGAIKGQNARYGGSIADVEKCTLLWHKAHFQAEIYKRLRISDQFEKFLFSSVSLAQPRAFENKSKGSEKRESDNVKK